MSADIMIEAQEMPDEYKNIKIKAKTHSRFEKYGKYSDTLDDVISRLMDFADEHPEEYRKKLEAN